MSNRDIYEKAVFQLESTEKALDQLNRAIEFALQTYRSVCLAGPELRIISGKLFIVREGSYPQHVHLMSEIALMSLVEQRDKARSRRDEVLKIIEMLAPSTNLNRHPGKDMGIRLKLVNGKLIRTDEPPQ